MGYEDETRFGPFPETRQGYRNSFVGPLTGETCGAAHQPGALAQESKS